MNVFFHNKTLIDKTKAENQVAYSATFEFDVKYKKKIDRFGNKACLVTYGLMQIYDIYRRLYLTSQ